MTIITLALTHDRQLALVADRLYAPFSNPQFMQKPKIFRRGPVVVGVSGNICSVDLEGLLSGKLPIQMSSKAHIIYINEDTQQILMAKPCGEDSFSTWFDPLLTGEPVTIGCFAHIVDTGTYGSIPTLDLALSRVNHLHLAFGHDKPADVMGLAIDYDKLIFDEAVDAYFSNQADGSIAFRRSQSVGMPLTKYNESKGLQSGYPSFPSLADVERVAEHLAKLFSADKGRTQP